MPARQTVSRILSATKVDDGSVARIARERAMLDEGIADIKTGRVVPDDEVDAMLDRFVVGKPLAKKHEKPKS
jgi:predicted transcriptional regulator